MGSIGNIYKWENHQKIRVKTPQLFTTMTIRSLLLPFLGVGAWVRPRKFYLSPEFVSMCPGSFTRNCIILKDHLVYG